VILCPSISGPSRRKLFCASVTSGLLVFFFFPLSLWAQLSTNDHLAEPGFWPTQNSQSRAAFVGPAA
jgi:hypothetical protein